MLKVLLFEGIGAIFFIFSIATIAWHKLSEGLSAVLVGVSYFLSTMLTMAMISSVDKVQTAAFLNPAASLLSGTMNLGYIVGPIIGGIIAVQLFKYIHTEDHEIERDENLKMHTRKVRKN